MVKKQRMRWSPRGAHLLLQVRTRVLNDDLAADFACWYPGPPGQSSEWTSLPDLSRFLPVSGTGSAPAIRTQVTRFPGVERFAAHHGYEIAATHTISDTLEGRRWRRVREDPAAGARAPVK
jgi:hypothetical protein